MKPDTKTLSDQLRQLNRWRRGDESLEQPEPYKIGMLLDHAAERMEELERELAAKDAHADEIYKAAVELAAKLERDLEQERQDRKQAEADICRALGERNDARAEAAEWKRRIIPFLAVHAGNYGRDHYGENCLHFTHYDLLEEAGGRMDGFTRCGESPAEIDAHLDELLAKSAKTWKPLPGDPT